MLGLLMEWFVEDVECFVESVESVLSSFVAKFCDAEFGFLILNLGPRPGFVDGIC